VDPEDVTVLLTELKLPNNMSIVVELYMDAALEWYQLACLEQEILVSTFRV